MQYKELLMKVTESVREEKEIEEFKKCLMEAAKEGKDNININKLEEKFPTIIKNGKLWKWLSENDIHLSGGADNNGKNVCYSFWWQ